MALDCLDGRLSRILSHKRGKVSPSGMPFLVGKLSTGAVVMGELLKPRVGEAYKFWGDWRAQKKYPEPAFHFSAAELVIDRSDEGISRCLSDYVKGLGPIKSAALVNAFGVDTLDVLRTDPDKALAVPGITPEIVGNIARFFAEECPFDPAAYAALIDLFNEHRIPIKVVKKLLSTWGSSAPEAVRANPYQLLVFHRMGWKTVDSLAIARIGYDPAGVERHAAALMEALDALASEGHTFGLRAELAGMGANLLGCPVIPDAWPAILATHKVVVDADHATGDETWALAKLDAAERTVARRVADIAGRALPLACDLSVEGLGDQQVDAVEMIEGNGLAILSGSPGTGKSFTTARVIKSIASRGPSRIICMAPTGKAAKRLAELMGGAGIPAGAVRCSTIHKALGPKASAEEPGVPSAEAKVGRGRDEFGFAHDESNPLAADFVVIDEASMMDVELADSTLSAVPLGARVLIVGDHNQLPSVGPGSVLRDVLDAGVPSTILTEIRRNSGLIVRACHAIKDGVVPTPADRVGIEAGDNWIHIEIDEPAGIAAEIVRRFEAVSANAATRFKDPLWDLQVISPQIDKPAHICCRDLNRLLSPILNPPRGDEPPDDPDSPGYAPPFRVGDKVVRTKNGLCDEMVGLMNGDRAEYRWRGGDYQFKETAIVNGDMGRVEDVTSDDKDAWVIVRFINPDRLCRLPYGDCHLTQAYAMTCHKAQGSGFPFVIVPVHPSFYWDNRKQVGIWNRELLYTCFSRAEQLLVTVGQFSAIRSAIGRRTVHRRRTRLADRLAEVMEVETCHP